MSMSQAGADTGGTQSGTGATGASGWIARELSGWVLKRAAWFTAIAVIGVTAVLIYLVTRGQVPDISIWQYLKGAPQWFLFAMGAVFSSSLLPVFVAYGRTRRSFVLGSHLAAVLCAALAAALLLAGFGIEGVIYGSLGWTREPDVLQAFSFTPALAASGYAQAFFLYLAAFAVFVTTGSLVGAAYYRFGGWYGTLLLPFTFLPAWLLQALADGWPADLAGLDPLTLPGFIGSCVLLFGLGLLANWLLLRNVPLRKSPL